MSRRALPAVLFAAAILGMAGPWASAERTGAVTSSFLTAFGLSEAVAALVNTVLRKCGHALAYGIFGVLVWRAVPSAGRPIRRPLVSLAFAVALATADELLQGLSPARAAASPGDVR